MTMLLSHGDSEIISRAKARTSVRDGVQSENIVVVVAAAAFCRYD